MDDTFYFYLRVDAGWSALPRPSDIDWSMDPAIHGPS
jgi:hypothetical protein